VDAASAVLVEVRARVTGRLVEREVGALRERQRDAAQPEAVGAVGSEVGAIKSSTTSRGIKRTLDRR